MLGLIALTESSSAESREVIRHPQSVPGQYFVGLDVRTPHALEHLAHSLAQTYGGTVVELFPAALGGGLFEFPMESAARLARDPRVRYVEENPIIEPSFSQVSAVSNAGDGTYLWYLDRIDQHYGHNLDGYYLYCNTGAGVPTYIIDTGIDETHPELQGRVAFQHDFFTRSYNVSNPCSSTWYGSHGTAVASIAGGHYTGVADDAILIGLKTLPCNAVTSNFLPLVAALNWIVTAPNQAPSYTAAPLNPYSSTPGVVNLSGWTFPGYVATDGSWTSPTIETVFQSVANAGNVIVTSADNYTWDACRFSPNNLAFGQPGGQPGHVITVGGTMLSGGLDYRWNDAGQSGQDKGSNSGNCISIWAPAANIYSARHSGYYNQFGVRYASASGTSFAAPIVSGMAARYMQYFKKKYGSSPPPSDVYSFLDGQSVKFQQNGTTPLVQGTATPTWTGWDPINGTTTLHTPVDTWRNVGMAHWTESCRVRPVRP